MKNNNKIINIIFVILALSILLSGCSAPEAEEEKMTDDTANDAGEQQVPQNKDKGSNSGGDKVMDDTSAASDDEVVEDSLTEDIVTEDEDVELGELI